RARGGEPAPGLGDAEDRGLGRDADVGALENLRAPGHREALDGGDDGLQRPVVAEERLPVDVRYFGHELHELVVRLAGAHRLEIGAGTEDVAAPGEDRDAQPRVHEAAGRPPTVPRRSVPHHVLRGLTPSDEPAWTASTSCRTHPSCNLTTRRSRHLRIALSCFCYRRRKILAPQGPRKLPKL